MNKIFKITAACIPIGVFVCFVQSSVAVEEITVSGETQFKEYCISCHADGGNIINPEKTLSRKDREKHGVMSAKDIVTLMRNPGEGMTTFDKNEVSDKEANAIAEYIVTTFK